MIWNCHSYSLLAYGSNDYGELCVGLSPGLKIPVKSDLSRKGCVLKQVQVANKATLALYSDGTIVLSGCNLYGALQEKYNKKDNVQVELPKLPNEKITQICAFAAWR